jgi:ribonuclease HI
LVNGIGRIGLTMTGGGGCYTFVMHSERSSLVVYTDGACRGNPGRGGWAWAVPGGRFASGAEAHTTNQRMEITAALEALRALRDHRSIEVVSDSTYVVNCFRQRWWQGWLRNDWKNSQKKPVANRDLWEPLFELALDPEYDIRFRWVKGHSGDRYNDEVDQLATEAADLQVGITGP